MATERAAWTEAARVRRLAISSAVALCFAATAQAQVPGEFVFGMQSSIGVTDNVTRSPTNEISEVIAGIGFVGSWLKEEGRLRGNAGWDFSYYTYLDDTFDDQVLGGLNLFAEYDLMPDRLTWMVQNNFGQSDLDPFASSNPGNVENVNYFTTGPDLTMQFGPRTSAVVSGRYSAVTYETSQIDNDRLRGEISLRRELSPSTTFSLNGSHERVEYDLVPPASSFDRQEAYAQFGFERERTTLTIGGGMTWLHDRGETFDGPLFRVTLNRRIGGYSSLSISGGQEFSDAGDVFRYGQETGGAGFIGTDNRFAIADPFERTYVTVGWSTDRERTGFSAYVNWSDESYETQTQFDRELLGARAEVTHALTLRTQLTGSLFWSRQDYQSGFDEDEWRFDLIYGWQVARPLYVDFTYRRWVRETSAFSGTAVENVFFVSLTYNFAQ